MPQTVKPDGSLHSKYVIVGEAPASEEVKQGLGFVGPSGKLLWPLLREKAGITRSQCYVTNLCKHPLPNDVSGDAKMSEAEFEWCAGMLRVELAACTTKTYILAVGALAAKALLGPQFTNMRACNGSMFAGAGMPHNSVVIPTWHPAAALRGGGGDKLAWTANAIAQMRKLPVPVKSPGQPPPILENSFCPPQPIAIDTEGTPEKPVCLTWAADGMRCVVWPEDVPTFWSSLMYDAAMYVAIYHNAPWDWAVLQAMGVAEPWLKDYHDTMELAYLMQTEPQGLKDLAWRHLRLRMKSWEEMVRPHWDTYVTVEATKTLVAHTVVETHSLKTGRKLKSPKVKRTGLGKQISRLMGNPDRLAELLGLGDIDTSVVPQDELVEYATLDAYATLELWKILRRMQSDPF